MAHLVRIEDETGDTIDLEIYCSDFCAQESEHYQGWNGCNEIGVSQPCESCEAHVQGVDEDE